MHPIIRHAVNGVLRLAPDFPVERYTWIVDPKGFIGGTVFHDYAVKGAHEPTQTPTHP